MLTFQSIGKVTKDHALAVTVATALEEGEYPVLVVLQEPVVASRRSLTFSNHHLSTRPGETFRREDLYCDDGR